MQQNEAYELMHRVLIKVLSNLFAGRRNKKDPARQQAFESFALIIYQ
jgi:hypothetical protein